MEKSVLEEDRNEETEGDEYSNIPTIKSVSEIAPAKLLTQVVQVQDEMQQTLL